MDRRLRRIAIRFFPYLYQHMRFYKMMGYKLDTKNPQTLTEKIFCFIMYNREPIYTQCADKVGVREYIKAKLGVERAEKICAKHYFVTEDVDSITMERLPKQFVLKSNHASGHIIICQDKSKFVLEDAKRIIKKWLRTNYYYSIGEYQYKNIVPKIICEELLDVDLVDYRIFCFDGKPDFIRVTKHDDRSVTGYSVGVYDLEWNPKADVFNLIEPPLTCKKPDNLDEMVNIAAKLSADFPFVRVDLYEVDGNIYFAELTFTPNGGAFRFKDKKTDLKYGQMVTGSLKK